jgi:DNA-binding NarL/FixJ family response regulator
VEAVPATCARGKGKVRRDDDPVGGIRVLIVDGQDLSRAGLRVMLERQGLHVVADVGTAEEALRLSARLSPEVVLLDLDGAGTGGALLPGIIARAPGARVVVLAAGLDPRRLIDALAAGACGYLAREESVEAIVAGIVRAAAAGQSLLSERTTRALIERLRELSPERGQSDGLHAKLTPRERDVLGLIVSGDDNGEIAAALFISVDTVKHHVSMILSKLEVQNRVQAAVQAVRGGFG